MWYDLSCQIKHLDDLFRNKSIHKITSDDFIWDFLLYFIFKIFTLVSFSSPGRIQQCKLPIICKFLREKNPLRSRIQHISIMTYFYYIVSDLNTKSLDRQISSEFIRFSNSQLDVLLLRTAFRPITPSKHKFY